MCAAIDGIEGMGVRTRTGRCAMVMSISPGTVGAMLARHIDAPTMCRHLDRAGKADSGGNIRATIRSKAAQASPCQCAIMAACKRSGPARSPQAICGGGTAARSPDAMLCAGSWETPFKVAATTLKLCESLVTFPLLTGATNTTYCSSGGTLTGWICVREAQFRNRYVRRLEVNIRFPDFT